MQEKSTKQADRRQFLKMAGFGAVATGAATALAGKDAQAATAAPAEDGKGAGYRETAHVKRYYELARF